MFNTPILFLIFNRPDKTEIVFNEIKKQKPKYLFIAADGPRQDHPEDVEKCKKSREIVLNGIDWDCEIKTLFRDQNLGCGLAVSGAISWFFDNVEEGIILEDDTLPDLSFFPYCKLLLEKYRGDSQVKMIGGNNFQNGKWRGKGSYYFSAYSHIWGWASWRRTWKQYSFSLDNLSKQQFNLCILNYFSNKKIREYWLSVFENVRQRKVDTWDYQFLFSIWLQNGITILPNANLVTNIGFGEESTHTSDRADAASNISIESIAEVIHPPKEKINQKADEYYFKKYLTGRKSFLHKIKKILIPAL